MRLTFKRLYLLCGKAARACASMAELTPARVDLLTLVMDYERSQSQLATLLCVTESVISRIVVALEKLGLVSRRIPDEDRRLRLVRITREGRMQVAGVTYVAIAADVTRGAQGAGEDAWLHHWKNPLARLGLDFSPLLQAKPPPLRTLRRHNHAATYLRWFGVDDEGGVLDQLA